MEDHNYGYWERFLDRISRHPVETLLGFGGFILLICCAIFVLAGAFSLANTSINCAAYYEAAMPSYHIPWKCR